MKKNILLIGGNSYTGSLFIKKYLEKYNIFSVARSFTSLPVSVIQIIVDLKDKKWVKHLPEIQFDCIVWAAQSMEYKNFPEAAEDIFEVNVAAIQYLLSHLYPKKTKIIYLSSGTVYRPSDNLLSEDSVCLPINYLGQTKLMGEQIITSYFKCFDCYILRIFTLYGPHQKGKLISNITHSIKNNTEIYLNKKSKIKICPLYVEDLLNLLGFIIDHNPQANCILNVAGEEVMYIEDILSVISKELKTAPNLVYKDEEGFNFIPQTLLLKSLFPQWHPTAFSSGIKNILANS